MRFCDLAVGDEFFFAESRPPSLRDLKRKVSGEMYIYTASGSYAVCSAVVPVLLVPPETDANDFEDVKTAAEIPSLKARSTVANPFARSYRRV